MSEFAFQRMHRRPVPEPKPFAALCGKDPFATTNSQMYSTAHLMEPPSVRVPSFTVGLKNDLGTNSNFRKINLDELRVGQVHLGNQARSWETTSASTHTIPQKHHPLHGADVPRSGLAPRLPYSEIGRRFGQVDSSGAMPGSTGRHFEGNLKSEAMTQYGNPGCQPRDQLTLTLGTLNDIGSSVTYQRTPTLTAGETHYSLGNQPRRSNLATTPSHTKCRIKSSAKLVSAHVRYLPHETSAPADAPRCAAAL